MLANVSSLLALATGSALAHMEITVPCPRYSSKCSVKPALPPNEVFDYNLKSPIGSGGRILAPLCHHSTPWPQVTETWRAGQPVTVEFASDGATHDSGHCEFSVSYDGGQTFVVVHQELKYCFYGGDPAKDTKGTDLSYTFTLPDRLPGTDHAVFSWSWVNASGNREFYNNCADIAIVGSAGSFTGKQMTIANYGGEYPEVPEFRGDYTTGLSYYTTNTTTVTVSGPGYGTDRSSSTSPIPTSSAVSTASSSSALPTSPISETSTAVSVVTSSATSSVLSPQPDITSISFTTDTSSSAFDASFSSIPTASFSEPVLATSSTSDSLTSVFSTASAPTPRTSTSSVRRCKAPRTTLAILHASV